MTRKLAFGFVCLWTFIACPTHADVISKYGRSGNAEIWIAGTINPGDGEKLTRLLSLVKFPNVYLDSLGGDVEESLKIGRFLRTRHAVAVVPAGKTCASACIFVLMGSPRRVVSDLSSVVIHRPYTTSNDDMAFDDREKRYRTLISELRAYFEEIHFSPELLNTIESIPPEATHTLSASELSRWGLNAIDPVEQEAQDAEQARNLGISMQEFLQRKQKLETVCSVENAPRRSSASWFTEFVAWDSKCRSDVLHGLR